MPGTVEVVIVGLCTLLNMRNEYSSLPEPSVIVVETGRAFGQTQKHVPFIAWDSTKVKADFTPANAFEEKIPDGATNHRFFELKGERVEIDNVASGTPDASEMGTIASYLHYRREPAATDWDRCYIPKPNERPQKKCVRGFMRFGGGTLTSARPTKEEYFFEDDNGATTVPIHYDQEVHYKTAAPGTNGQGQPFVVINLRNLDDDAIARTVKLTAISGDTIEIFLANTMIDDIKNVVLKTNTDAMVKKSLHFHALSKAVLEHTDIPIPVVNRDLPAHSSGPGGGDSGYCGPESKP